MLVNFKSLEATACNQTRSQRFFSLDVPPERRSAGDEFCLQCILVYFDLLFYLFTSFGFVKRAIGFKRTDILEKKFTENIHHAER